ILESPWYRELFPKTILKRSAWHDIETTAGGGRLATSITGTLTGRGGDTIILDDLIKPQEADSETIRANVNAWYQSTLTSRLNDKRKGAIICVMQRLHEYDVAGLMIESGRYDVLSLPAVSDHDQSVPLPRGQFHLFKTGAVLHPAREDRKVLEDIRAEMGSDRFSAQFLQNPVPAGGNLIKAIWLKVYDPATVLAGGGIIVQCVDSANKANPNSDFSVIVTALVQGKYVYVLDVFRARLEFPELRAKIVELAEEYRPDVLLIEDKASGEGLISEFRTPDYPTVPMPIARKAVIDKVSRVDGVTGMIEGGQLLLPPNAPWSSEYKAELLAFPSGRYDDQVDATAHLLEWVRERHSVPVQINAGPELMDE
ncbi:MAG: terminase, partial [Hyphomicrobiales bacterium]